jgi:hypothetical protein
MRLSSDIARLAPLAMAHPNMRSTVMVLQIYWDPAEADDPCSWDWISILEGHAAEGEIVASSDHAPWGDDPSARYPWPDKEVSDAVS